MPRSKSYIYVFGIQVFTMSWITLEFIIKFNSSLKLFFSCILRKLVKHTDLVNERKKMMNSNIKKKKNHDYIVDYYMTKNNRCNNIVAFLCLKISESKLVALKTVLR